MAHKSSRAFLLKTFTLGCASAEKDGYAQRYQVKPPGSDETAEDLFIGDQIPQRLLELIGHISRECMVQEGNFRVPGSAAAKRSIITAIKTNQPIDYSIGSKVLTAAVQGFTRDVKGGLMSKELELRFQNLSEVTNEDLEHKYQLTADIMSDLRPVIRTYITLIFGLLFRYVQHKCWHKADAHAVALASGGCLFVHSYADTTSVSKIHTTIEWLIENFPVSTIWGRDNLQLFCDVTMSGLVTKQLITHRFMVKELMAEYELHCQKTGSQANAAVFMKRLANHIRKLNKKYNAKHFNHERLKPRMFKQEIYRSADCMKPLRPLSVSNEPGPRTLYHHGSADQLFEFRRSIASRRESIKLRQAVIRKQRRQFLESRHEQPIPENFTEESKTPKIFEEAEVHHNITEDINPSLMEEPQFQIPDEVIERTYTIETVFLPSTAALSGDSQIITGNLDDQFTVKQLIVL